MLLVRNIHADSILGPSDLTQLAKHQLYGYYSFFKAANEVYKGRFDESSMTTLKS